MNKTKHPEQLSYEPPEIRDIPPVSVVCGDDPVHSGPDEGPPELD